ncbi:MAG: hypothetical protein R3F11_06710 [Verrucomicrobiales bacterium]
MAARRAPRRRSRRSSAGRRRWTRLPRPACVRAANLAMLLALMWYSAGGGKGAKDMVILPP